uniref:Uncharacterized protein n=1 Tax=Haptolina ericina TaxID=156174 RepID=A0A7S3B7L4_9EUKA
MSILMVSTAGVAMTPSSLGTSSNIRVRTSGVMLTAQPTSKVHASIEAWINSKEIQSALHTADHGHALDPELHYTDDGSLDEGADIDHIEEEGIAVPGCSSPAHARPLPTADEASFIVRALREEAFLGAGGELMGCKSKKRRDENAAAALGRHAAAAVVDRGVARLQCLSAGTAARLRAHVLEELEELTSTVDGTSTEEGFRLVAVGSGTQRLSNLVGAVEGTTDGIGENRWDLRLSPDVPVVKEALRELLAWGAPLGVAFRKVVGEDAALWEVSAIVSAPGAPPQIVHADAVWTPAPLLVTSFIALQPVRRNMGPTRFLPQTHTNPAFAAVLERGDATGLLPPPTARAPPSCVALLQPGEAALYDGRLLHCGGANRSDELRVLFYLTFRSTSSGVGDDELGDEGGGRGSDTTPLTLCELINALEGAPLGAAA